MNKVFPLEEVGPGSRILDPCILVIMGATGDLTARRLLPAIYHLGMEGLLPSNFLCVGFARREKSQETFRKEALQSIEKYSRSLPVDLEFWEHFQERIFYHSSTFEDDKGYEQLRLFLQDLDQRFQVKGNRIFYLATAPKYFSPIVEKLHHHHLLSKHSATSPWTRVIVEKPFGTDLSSAQLLQKQLLRFLQEEQLYRIDHWLGKETVQNLLVFRFANSLFESFWNYKFIDHVQITFAEDEGILTRGALFEEQGILRDVIQNHLMQLLSLIAMEPPVNLSPQAIHDEKVKILQSIHTFSEKEVSCCSLRGQYGPGYIHGVAVPGYRQEQNVDESSQVETFSAIKLFVNNWRWASVPFYLRAGKRLPKRATEIAIVFKEPPGFLFQLNSTKNETNILVVRIQPEEGIALRINSKVPGQGTLFMPVKMDFRYESYFGQSPPEAYERLIYDCMIGDSTLFTREDEVMHSWRILTPILDYWKNEKPKHFPDYEAGTWGPKAAEEWIEKEGRQWRLL